LPALVKEAIALSKGKSDRITQKHHFTQVVSRGEGSDRTKLRKSDRTFKNSTIPKLSALVKEMSA